MNFNFYIFGNPRKRFSQYPQDYTREFLEPLAGNLDGSRAMIYRKLDLTYYAFVESLGENMYMGICMVFNKVRASHPKQLFDFMKSVIESQALKNGKIIQYTTEGNIVFVNPDMSDDTHAYEYLRSVINSMLENKKNNFGINVLPSRYEVVSKTEYIFSTEPNKVITQLSDHNSKVVIDYGDGIRSNSTHKIILSLQEQLYVSKNTIDSLSEEITELERQKKQYRNVIVLFLLVLACCIGLFFLYDSLYQTEKDLHSTTKQLVIANDSITVYQAEISTLRTKAQNLLDTVSVLHKKLDDTTTELSDTKRELSYETQSKISFQDKVDFYRSVAPLVITKGSLSFSGDYLKVNCTYYASSSFERKYRIRVISGSTGEVIANSNCTVHPSLGSGSFSITAYHERGKKASFYTVEIVERERIIGGFIQYF